MSGAVIRECTRDDIESVLEMARGWEAEDSTYGYVAEKADELAGRIGPYFLVAESRGCVVGYAFGSVHVSEGTAVLPAGEAYVEVDAIYVAAEHRSSGIGGMLLDGLLEAARRNGVERSLVYSATRDLEKVLRFYRRHGFKNWYVRMYR